MAVRNILVLIGLILVSCQKSGGGGDDAETNDADTDHSEVPLPNQGTGQLIFSIPPEVDPESVSGYVVGSQDELTVAKAGQVYYINNIPEGKQDVILTAGSLAVTALTATIDRGLRENGISVRSGEKVDLSQVTIPVAGKLSGVAKLSGLNDNAGIRVYIPGTQYDATTDKDGKFFFDFAPVGTHEVYFEFDSFNRVEKADVDVASNATTDLGEITLEPSSGPVGVMKLNDGAKTATSQEVIVQIEATTNTLFMKIGEEANLLTAVYQPFQNTLTWTFSATGAVTLYARLKDKDGLESAIFSATITIGEAGTGGDTTPPAAPENLSVTPGDGQAVVSWDAVTASDLGGYLLARSASTISWTPTDGTTYSDGDVAGDVTMAYVGSSLAHTDTSVINGVEYYYRVFAYDDSKNYSDPSTEDSGIPQAAPMSGVEAWTKTVDVGTSATIGMGDLFMGVAVGPDGHPVAVGQVAAGTGTDLLIVKFDKADGTILFNRTFDGDDLGAAACDDDGEDKAYDVAIDSAGRIVVVGVCEIAAFLNRPVAAAFASDTGNLIWGQRLSTLVTETAGLLENDFLALAINSQDVACASYSFHDTGPPAMDTPRIKCFKVEDGAASGMDANVIFDGTTDQYITALLFDKDDNLYAGGQVVTGGGATDAWVRKYDDTFTVAASLRVKLGAIDEYTIHDLDLDGAGNIYGGGTYEPVIGADPWIFKLPSSLASVTWETVVTPPVAAGGVLGTDSVFGTAVDVQGSPYFATQATDIDSLTSEDDIWVMKAKPSDGAEVTGFWQGGANVHDGDDIIEADAARDIVSDRMSNVLYVVGWHSNAGDFEAWIRKLE